MRCATIVALSPDGDPAAAMIRPSLAEAKCVDCELSGACASASGLTVRARVPRALQGSLEPGMRVAYTNGSVGGLSALFLAVVPCLLFVVGALGAALLGAAAWLCATVAVALPLLWYLVASLRAGKRSSGITPEITKIIT